MHTDVMSILLLLHAIETYINATFINSAEKSTNVCCCNLQVGHERMDQFLLQTLALAVHSVPEGVGS